MNTRTLGILLAATVVVLVLAVWSWSRRVPDQPAGENELVYPALADRANDVTGLEVIGPEDTFHVVKRDDTWGIEEKGHYPVEFENVREAVVGLSHLELVEPKTSKPESYSRIGVQDPSEEGAESTLVRVRDSQGQQLAALIVGERSYQGREQRVYVRKEGQKQSWLAQGPLVIDADPMRWVDRSIIRIPRERVRSVSITHPDGECVFIYRDSDDQRDFQLADIPEGRELRSPGVANSIASSLASLRMEDVVPADGHSFDPEKTTTVEIRTFDGLVVDARVSDDEGDTWATFDVSADVPEQEAPAEEEAPPAEDAEATEADDEEPDVEAEAAELAARLGPWAYQLSPSAASSLTKRMKDLLKEVDEEPVTQ